MPDPKKPTAAEKLMMLRNILKQRHYADQPPSPRVQAALKSFGDTAPTPEEIQKAVNDLLNTGDHASALEFEVYAQEGARKENMARDAAQRQYDAGSPPLPVVDQALKSFKQPPTPEQVKTLGDYLRSTAGPEAAQQFETYAANIMPKPKPPAPLPPQAVRDYVPGSYANGDNVGDRVRGIVETTRYVRGLPPTPTPSPQPPAPQAPAAAVAQAGPVEAGLLTKAFEYLTGMETDPEVRARMDRAVRGDAKPSPGGFGPIPKKKAKEEKRDLNKERDLLNAAKEIHEEPRRGNTDTTPIDIDELRRDMFRNPGKYGQDGMGYYTDRKL